jgi:hypothetical protein
MSTFTRFQKLRTKAPTAWLGHVFVGILTMNETDRSVIAEGLNDAIGEHLEEIADGATLRAGDPEMAEMFQSLLELPPSEKRAMVKKIDHYLDKLCFEEWFGANDERDPRGDHR